MALLGIDYGKKRIGLALMQEGSELILPLGTVMHTEAALTELAKVCAEQKIATLVIGLPLGLDGKDTQQTDDVRAFGARLADHTGHPVVYVDERFSSRGADAHGPYTDGASRDERAAMIILETYASRVVNE